jgi:hypothetical protein
VYHRVKNSIVVDWHPDTVGNIVQTYCAGAEFDPNYGVDHKTVDAYHHDGQHQGYHILHLDIRYAAGYEPADLNWTTFAFHGGSDQKCVEGVVERLPYFQD